MSINPVPLQGDREEWHCSREGRKDRRGHLLGDFASISFPWSQRVSTFTLRASPQIQPRSSSQWETSIPVDQRLAAALPLISQGSSPVSKGACTTGSPWMGGVSTRPQNRCNEGTFYIFWKAHPQSRVCSSVACFRILRAHRDGRCQRIPLRKKCPSQKRS